MCVVTKMIFKIFLISVFVNYVTLEDIKVKSKRINPGKYSMIPCIDNDDCDYVGGTCENDFCKCNGSMTCIDKNNVITMKIGETCDLDGSCNVENSYCFEERCKCKDGLVATSNMRRCIEISEGLGSSCEDDVQCNAKTPSSGCQDNKCTCQQHMHEYNGSCYKNVALKEPCERDEECSLIIAAKCLDSKCTCLDKHVVNGSKCLPIAQKVNDVCMEDVQCSTTLGGGALCHQGFCQCRELYQLKKSINKCVRDMLLGDTCATHNDCHQPGYGPSRLECIVGECKCQSEYFEVDGYCINGSSKTKFFVGGIFATFIIVYLL